MTPYPEEVERTMKQFYDSLSEKDRRRYAGIEALKYGHGGREYISRVLGCSRRTVSKGAKEMSGLPQKEVENRIRRPGGGRKSYAEQWPEIDAQFLSVLQNYTAGDPMDANVLWTNLPPREIAQALEEQHDVRVSVSVVRKLLKKHGYRRRKAQKKATMKEVEHRYEQFEYIAGLRTDYEAAGNPVLSMDTKKKEFLGNFYREGHLYTLTEL